MAPAERIKVLLQVQQGEKKSASTIVKELYREGGVRSIWKVRTFQSIGEIFGLTISCLFNILFGYLENLV